jgi:hypothetical protein
MELFKIGFLSVRLIDIIDISLVTFMFFRLYELLRGQFGHPDPFCPAIRVPAFGSWWMYWGWCS